MSQALVVSVRSPGGDFACLNLWEKYIGPLFGPHGSPKDPPKIRSSQVALELGPKDWFNPAAGRKFSRGCLDCLDLPKTCQVLIQLGEEW